MPLGRVHRRCGARQPRQGLFTDTIMTVATLYLILLVCFCISNPRVHCNLIQDIDYMDRQRTSFVNGYFIAMVLIGHTALNWFNLDAASLDCRVIRMLNGNLSQLVVSTFFFYTGYGLMCSYLAKGKAYPRKVLTNRFPRVWLNFALGVTAYYILSLLLSSGYSPSDYLLALTGWRAVGNPSWFVCVTLCAYLAFSVSFLICKREKNCLLVFSLLMLIFSCILVRYKSPWWCNTMLCIPAGMAFRLYRAKVEFAIAAMKSPAIVWGGLLVLLGWMGYFHVPRLCMMAGIPYHTIHNLFVNGAAVSFAFGITLLHGCIHFSPCRFMVWAGGVALFPIYMYQVLPMHVLSYCGMDASHPFLFVSLVTLLTLALAPIVIRVQDFLWNTAHKARTNKA